MANPYSKYTGSRISPVPAGYLAAAAQSAEGVRKSGEKFGDMIGAGIAKYYEGKEEARGQEAWDSYRKNRGYSTEEGRDEEPSVEEPSESYKDPMAETPVEEPPTATGRRGGTIKDIAASTQAEGWAKFYGHGGVAAQDGEAEQLSVPPAPQAPAERYIPTLNERLEAGNAALLGTLDKYGNGISGKMKKDIFADHERWIDRTTNQFNADRLHKLRVETEDRLGKPTAVNPSALTEKLNELDAMAKAADSRGTPWTTEKLEERRLEILDIAGAAGATAKVAEWNKFTETGLWADASDAEKKTWTERFFVKPPEGDKTTLQKNIQEFNNRLLSLKASGEWTEKGEAQLRGDYGLTSKAEIDLQAVTLQLKERDLAEGDFKLDPVVMTMRDEAGNKLPYGLIKTSKGSAMYVQLNPGIGMDKSNFSTDANRLTTMMKQYAGSFSYKDDLGDLITRDMKTASPQERATIDATAMLIMGMQRNMGLKVSSYPSVVNPSGPPLKPAVPAPKDEKEVERRQNTRESREKDDVDDSINRLTPTKKR